METDYIRLGDCLELMKEIPDGSVDMVMFDAPFYQLRDKVNADNKLELYKKWIGDMAKQFYRVLKAGGNVCYLNAPKYMYHTAQIFFDNRLEYRNDIPLIRPRSFCPAYMLGYQHNILMFLCKDGDKKSKWNGATKNHDHSFPTDVWSDIEYNTGYYGKGGDFHPEAISEMLTARCIELNTHEEDVVLDPCIGSGTTGVVCIKTNRRYIGFELQPEYYEIARKRIEDEKKQLTLF